MTWLTWQQCCNTSPVTKHFFLISNFCRVLKAVCLFWAIPWRLNFICRRFETLCLFHLHRQVGMKYDWIWENLQYLYRKSLFFICSTRGLSMLVKCFELSEACWYVILLKSTHYESVWVKVLKECPMSTVNNRLSNGITPNYRVSAGRRENRKTVRCNCRETGSHAWSQGSFNKICNCWVFKVEF